MQPGVALVLLSKLDLNTFLPLARRLLDYSVSKSADSFTFPDLAHQLVCIESFKNKQAPPKVTTKYLELFSAGFLIAADEYDMLDILEATRGMPFIVTDTIERGIQVAIIHGSLAQWRRSIKLACEVQTTHAVKYVYNDVYRILCEHGLKNIFDGMRVTSLLERY